MPKCLKCSRTAGLTRSHVPMRFVSRWAFGSLKKAFKAGKIQIYWLCEGCRREHQVLERELVQHRMRELVQDLEELHRRFCAQSTNS